MSAAVLELVRPTDQPATSSAAVTRVPLNLLDDAPAEQDSRHATGDVTDLADSIGSVGLLQPIGVRRSGPRYTIVFGHRRAHACRQLGWTSIPVVFVDAPVDGDLLKSLIENVQRKQLSGRERAAALERLVATGIKPTALARRLGKSQQVCWAWLKVGRSQVLLQALSDNIVGINQARQLSALDDPTINALLPELAGKPLAWQQARIARATDDAQTQPPVGAFKRNAETHVLRSLELILEHARSIKEIRRQQEIDVLREIIALVGQWQRDLLRASAPP